MLGKGAITKVKLSKDQFLSNIFTAQKKKWWEQTSDLKHLNSYIHCRHFKMEDLFLVKQLLLPNDWMVKMDRKDAYFPIPIHQNSQKFLRFEWEGSVYQLPRLLVFTKLLKISIPLC